MPLLCEREEARCAAFLFQRNPILYAPREGSDYLTCWTCRNSQPLVQGAHECLASDAAWCGRYDELIDLPHEPLSSDDAHCWGRT